MSDLKIWIGEKGAQGIWYLNDKSAGFTPIDISLLPGPKPTFSTVNSVTDSYTGPWSNTQIFDKRVIADTQGGVHTFDVVKYWNDVKNIQATSSEAENLVFDGFVHIDAQIGTNSNVASHLIFNGAKRVNAITGNGNDTIEINMLTNLGAWQDDFRIFTGAGDDTIIYRGLDIEGELAAGDTTYTKSATDERGLHSGGEFEISWTDAGAGNDRVIGYNSRDNIIGNVDDGSFSFAKETCVTSSYAYAIGGDKGNGCGDHDSVLYKIDLNTGKTVKVGDIKIVFKGKTYDGFDIESLAYNAKDGQLYGIINEPGKLSGLFKVDPLTAKTTFIGGNVSNHTSNLQDVAFDKEGNLFLINEGCLLKVNTTNGNTTSIANKLDKKIAAVAIDIPTGKLYALAEDYSKTTLYEIDKATGKVLDKTTLKGLGWCSDIEGMSFDAKGQLWAVDRVSGDIIKINVDTGKVDYVSQTYGSWKMSGDGFEHLAIKIDVIDKIKGIDVNKGDVLTGGGGEDNFIYRAGDGVDTITDYIKGSDKISISGYTAADIALQTYGSDTYILFKDGSSDGFVDSALIKVVGVTGLTTADLFFG